jgi:hypothetical protein
VCVCVCVYVCVCEGLLLQVIFLSQPNNQVNVG